MQMRRPALMTGSALVALLGIAWAGAASGREPQFAAPKGAAGEPTNSTPIALTHDDRFAYVANPDNDSVSVIEVGSDVDHLVELIPVGREPQCVAISPDDRKVYVTNQVSGTVSVISTRLQRVVRTIPVGTEPFGCALTPSGRRLYVANSLSDTVTVINTVTDRVLQTIPVGPMPMGIAITGDLPGGDRVFVTHFLAQLRNDGRSIAEEEGRDDGKEGRVTVIGPAGVLGQVTLNPLADTGFKSNGSTLDRIPLANPAAFTFTTGAFPNLLQSIVIRGHKAYLPNTASSPNGPFRFNVNMQAFMSVFDLDTGQEAPRQTINMNSGVQFEPPDRSLFITNPIAVAFKHAADEGFVVSAATNRLVRVVLDAVGRPTINAPAAPGDLDDIVRIEVGKDPQGIVINSTDTRAYVMNFISRDVSVVDIETGSPTENTAIDRIRSAALPPNGTLEAIAHRGQELFNTGIGPAGTQAGALPPGGRMSAAGWGSCYGCHPNGRTDGVTWMFADGPRQAISLESTFAHPQPPGAQLSAFGAPLLPSSDQRVLNWSAVRDEVQDFELNIRGVSGGQGLIANADGSQDPCVFNLVVPPGSPCPPEDATNTGRSADLDAIAAYIAFGIRAPVSPVKSRLPNGRLDFDLVQGRQVFARARCQSCHGGPKWTRSRVDFAPPPVAAQINAGQLFGSLVDVGTFDPNAFNEVKANQPDNLVANGGLGINVPSLLSVFASAPYFHSGSAPTLEDVLNNVPHRAAGTGGVDTLASANRRHLLVKFLRSIDGSTQPFP